MNNEKLVRILQGVERTFARLGQILDVTYNLTTMNIRGKLIFTIDFKTGTPLAIGKMKEHMSMIICEHFYPMLESTNFIQNGEYAKGDDEL